MFRSKGLFSENTILRRKSYPGHPPKTEKVKEFREIAEKIKQDIAFDWNANPNKIYMPEEKRNAYINEGGIHHLDKEYTVSER